MSEIYGIRVRLGRGPDAIHVFAGWGVQRYGFANRALARWFIEHNWSQFDAGWRRRHLSVGPLPPWVTVRPEMLIMYGRTG